MEQEETKPAKVLRVTLQTAQLIILAYSTASAVKGLNQMGKDAFNTIDKKVEKRKRRHLKAV